MTHGRRALLLGLLLVLTGCDQPRMRHQPKYLPYQAAPGFQQGYAALPPPAGTVARDALPPGVSAPRPPLTLALLRRGQDRFNAFCAPCHNELGDGRGMIVQRGFPSPPSFHSERLRQLNDAQIYDVITHGYGIMYSYADRVPGPDRWAIIAYIRALQLSQHANVAELPADIRAQLTMRGRP